MYNEILVNYKQILKNEFPSTIRRRGQKLYDASAVRAIHIDVEDNSITGAVQGGKRYKQEIKFTEDLNQILFAHCTCPYGEYCKHQAALLYMAKSKIESNDDQDKELISKRNGQKKAKTAKKRSSKKGLPKAVSRSEFIALPYTRFNELFNQYCNKRNRILGASISSELSVNAQYQLVVTLYKSEYWRNEKEYLCHVEIKTLELNHIHIRCSICEEKDKFLCGHMQIALNEIKDMDRIQLLESAQSHVKGLYAKAAKSLSLSVANFSKHFSVIIQYGQIYVKSNDQNVILNTDHFSFINIDSSNDKQYAIELSNVALKEASLTYAIQWLGSESINIVDLISGKIRKRDGVIKTQIQEGGDASKLPQHLREMYKVLSSLESDYDFTESEFTYYNNVHQVLLKQHDTLTLDKHYYYDDNAIGSYYETKKKAKYFKHFTFKKELVDLKAIVSVKDGLYHLTFILIIDDTPLSIDQMAFFNKLFLVIGEEAYIFFNHDIYYLLREIIKAPSLSFLPRDKDLLVEQIARLKHKIDFDIDPNLAIKTTILSNTNKSLFLTQQENTIFIEPKLSSEDNSIAILDEDFQAANEAVIEIDKQERSEFIKEIKSLHPDFSTQVHEFSFLFLNTNQFIEDLWFYDFYEKCKVYGIEVFGQENLNDFNYSRHRPKITSSIKSGIDWFDVDVSMSFGDQDISNKAWINAIKSNERFIKLDDGSQGVIPQEWFDKLKHIHTNTELIKGELKISKFNFNLIDQLFEDIDDETTLLEIAKKRARIDAIKSTDTKKKKAIPKAITASLRPYQHQGYNWLCFLHESGFGGILADDMGLGKTLQVLCILAYAVKKKSTPNLIIVPRSLLFNWAKEIEKFAVALHYVVHHGPNRARSSLDSITDRKIIISTYDTVASDIILFQDIEFNYVVLDESQAIKNPSSKRYKAMRLLQAKHRLTMTGTPIENNTFDLYAQMSFVNPGCFGSAKKFKERYSTPIDVNGDADAAQMLKQMIYPFLLRRTKEQVATDLPEKTESIIYCEMPKDQRKKYEELKKAIKQDVYKMIKEDGLKRSRFKILEGLLRLRQMCNSPKILEANSQTSSAKIEKIEELLSEDLAGKNVLIFSQFVSMLTIIKDSLVKLNKKFAYLDGQTRDREKAVNEFLDDDSCQVFLISLKAGNTGLNLTKADYVFIVDPWWNPAVEAQAIDRTHRIGQVKQVFAYRLICKDTIEEKIMALKDKKRKVASDIISIDDQQFKSMDKKQILNLFE